MRGGRKSWDCASLVPGYSPWRLQRHEHSRLSLGPYAWVDGYNDPSGVTELLCIRLLRPLKGSVLGVSDSGGIARMLSHAASTPGYRLSSLRDGFDYDSMASSCHGSHSSTGGV